MPGSKQFTCVRVWRVFGEQVHPRRRFLYREAHRYSRADGGHVRKSTDSAENSARTDPAPAAEKPQPAPAAEKPQPAPAAEKPQPAPAAEKPQPAPAAEKPQPAAETSHQAAPARIVISYIHFIGATKRTQADEFIEIKNLGGTAQELSGWRINASGPGQEFTFPAGSRLAPGAIARVFTNIESADPGHYSFGSKRAIWNDDGDLGQLFDQNGTLIARYGYGSQESRTIDSIKEACGVPRLQVVYTKSQLPELVKYRGKVDFFTALERALRCLLEEPSPGKADAAALQKRLIEQLNRQEILLLSATDLRNPEDIKKSWFFRLGGYRIVVDRSGTEPASREYF